MGEQEKKTDKHNPGFSRTATLQCHPMSWPCTPHFSWICRVVCIAETHILLVIFPAAASNRRLQFPDTVLLGIWGLSCLTGIQGPFPCCAFQFVLFLGSITCCWDSLVVFSRKKPQVSRKQRLASLVLSSAILEVLDRDYQQLHNSPTQVSEPEFFLVPGLQACLQPKPASAFHK